MVKRRLGRIFAIPLVLVMAITLVGTSACTPSELEKLNGILQNVDSANGEITIVTKDGKTITLKIDTETKAAANGATVAVTNLEPGAPVEVEVKKNQPIAQRIQASQSKIEGTVTAASGNTVTIQDEKNRQTTVQVTESTRTNLNVYSSNATSAGILAGTPVEVVYDPTTRTAIKIIDPRLSDPSLTSAGIKPGTLTREQERERERERTRLQWGILEIRVTDPGPADVKSAVVYLKNIEVHRASDNTSGSDNNSGEWITVTTNITSFDLMDVIGVEKFLASANLTAGKYTQIRMDVTKVEGVTTDNTSFTAEVPSDKLKIVGAFNIDGGSKTVLTLDFDGEKSLVRTGSGKFLFKPVVKLLVNSPGQTSAGQGQKENVQPVPGTGQLSTTSSTGK